MHRLSLRERPLRAVIASILALVAAGLAVYHAVSWPLTALAADRAWEVGGMLPSLLLTLAFVLGATLLGAGGVLLLRGYYGLAARLILAGGVVSGYGVFEIPLAILAALIGGTVRPPEDKLL